MELKRVEQQIVFGTRMVTLVAVVASIIGAVLMLFIGLQETLEAFRLQLLGGEGLPKEDASAVHLISALDRFLLAIVLLYFAYGIYVLFVRPDRTSEELGIPPWLRVAGIGQLKQTLAEVILVVLFVLFLRVAMESFVAGNADMSWHFLLKFLALPVAIFLLAAALKLAELHPKDESRTRGRP